ncbi:FecR family protein [Sinomicrobium sp. M5D2P17]
MDKKQNIKIEFNLIIKKLEGVLTEKEKEEFDRWYAAASPEDLERFRDIEDFHLRNNRMPFAGKAVPQKDQSKSPEGKQKPYWWLGVAASVALLVSLGIYFYDHLIPGSMPEATIEVGSSKAVLTLEDGTEVALKKGEEYTSGNIYSNGAQIVYDTKNTGHAMTYNQLTVPRGGEYFLLLADSTKVWLNSDTKIKYPKTFTDGQPRIVELLYGEAFFEVSPATEHGGSAFKVVTRNQEIEVLGTEFNISAYKEDQAVTSTLVEGKVMVKSGDAKQELTPGDQAVIREGYRGILLRKVDVYNYMAWKEGYFGYEDQTLYEIMQMLSRWYDVKITFANEELKDIRFGGVLSRREPIEGLLQMFSGDIDYEIQGKQVVIKSKE